MEEVIYLNNLYDYYKDLLTDKQRLYFEDYYQNNLSLSEMALNYDVRRNAIHKQLKDTVKLLNSYEDKLKMFFKMNEIVRLIKSEKNDILLEKVERIIG